MLEIPTISSLCSTSVQFAFVLIELRFESGLRVQYAFQINHGRLKQSSASRTNTFGGNGANPFRHSEVALWHKSTFPSKTQAEITAVR